MFDDNGATTLSTSSEGNAHVIEIQFKDDRKEWVNRIVLANDLNAIVPAPDQFKVFAREEENEPWVELMAIRRVEWWARKQEKPVLFVNDKPYNAYRIVDLQRVRNEQATLSRVELSCVSLYNASSLEYPSLQWYDNMEIDPVVPRNGVFSFFSNSFLPSGIKLDSASGALIGKPWPAFHFQIHITAVSITNETLTVQLVGDVLKCEGNRVPIRVRIAVKDAPNEYAYQLFREESGGRVLIGSESSFARNTVYSRDYCVPRGRLSIDFISQSKSGWEAGSSYSVSMDDMVLVSGSVSESAQAPSVAREFFSTVQPATEEMAFAVSTTEEANWMLNEFDDAKWERVALRDLAMKPSFFVRSVAPLMLVENATATVRWTRSAPSTPTTTTRTLPEATAFSASLTNRRQQRWRSPCRVPTRT